MAGGNVNIVHRQNRPSRRFLMTCRLRDIIPARYLLEVRVSRQIMRLFERLPEGLAASREDFAWQRDFLISTSRYGVGQRVGSEKTPLGLHRIAEKIGAGYPVGTSFSARQAVGYTWAGHPGAPIAHRILRLDGLEPGFNRGGKVDTHARYIYIHGVGDEVTLGRPASIGCIYLAAHDLMPLFDRLTSGDLVWIET